MTILFWFLVFVAVFETYVAGVHLLAFVSGKLKEITFAPAAIAVAAAIGAYIVR